MVSMKRTWILGAILVASLAGGTSALAAGAGGGGSSASDDDALRGARELISQERYEEALAALERVVAADERDADAWNLVGYSLRKLGRYDEAMEGYARALALDPRHAEAIEYLGELHLALDDLAEAERQLVRLGEICPSGCDEYDELKEAIDRYRGRPGRLNPWPPAAPRGVPRAAGPCCPRQTAFIPLI